MTQCPALPSRGPIPGHGGVQRLPEVSPHALGVDRHEDRHPPVEMRDIALDLAGEWTTARAVGLDADVPVSRAGRYTRFVLPRLGAYDVVVLE